ncbi:porin [Pseudaminobacter soli (ex Zhang et al. 2022)]|uniref:porin n=1 Tax=Pseudaminobacter soli (ex Zhang et al. 2022) TaxID=2831468 RepID=UPI001AEEDE38|nr:porin [Pseudaminobacter soli]
MNEKATFNAEVGYDDFSNFSIATNIAYQTVPGLTITPEIDYLDNFDVDNSDALGVNVRFQRTF